MCHAILIGALVSVWLQCPVGPRARSLLSTAHGNHAGVQQLTIGPQLCVDTVAVFLTVPVDVLPLTLANWMEQRPVILALSKWSQERVSQPEKIE
jgi:hypothetical protein